MSMYQTHILKNGLKVIHQQVDGKAAWCGLIIGVGSRDERPEEEGIAHFIEHVIFKGTEKRKAFHILSRIEDVGGELNAYTTKEDTCIYASFLARDYERALELFADIVFHSVFPEKEIEKEEKWQKNNKKKTVKYIFYLLCSGVLLFVVGELLGNTLENLCNQFNISQTIIGILLGFITSIPELITFFEAQKHYKKNTEDAILGVVEATNNLFTSNILNLFVIQSIGIIIYSIFA